MLLNDFFTLRDYTSEAGTVQATLIIDAEHRIFEGHFPGQPVTPGVCIMQMIKELAEKAVGVQLRLIRADDMKFLSIIDPQKNDTVSAKLIFSVIDNTVNVSATVSKEEVTHFKFKGSFAVHVPL